MVSSPCSDQPSAAMTDHPETAPSAAAVLAAEQLDAAAALPPDGWLPLSEALFRAQEQGHSYLPLPPAQTAALKAAAPVVGDGSGYTPLVLCGNRLYSGRVYAWETEIAARLSALAAARPPLPDTQRAAHCLQEWFAGEASQEQQAAAALALLQTPMLITGGPGTGKTTTVAKLLALLCTAEHKLPRIALAAPTGKAAAHMTRALHRALNQFDPPATVRTHLSALEGQTVHRLLNIHPLDAKARFDSSRPLPYDVIVADEASMLDYSLLLKLLRAVRPGCRLILLGDEHQLPPVGLGTLLPVWAQETRLNAADAAQLAALLPHRPPPFDTAPSPPPLADKVARLTRSHRFQPERGIGLLGQAVVNGDSAAAQAAFERHGGDLALLPADVGQLAAAFEERRQAYWAAVATGDAESCFRLHQQLTVLTVRRAEANAFNQAHRALLIRKQLAAEEGYFAGAVLMAAENDYTVRVFNGDIGIVLPHENTLAAYFPDGTGYRAVALPRLPRCEPAFALTVHKSQGSEYGEVWLLPPPDNTTSVFDRSLLYTAVTRARERFAFAGGTEQLTAAVGRRHTRRSGLAEALSRHYRPSAAAVQQAT